MAGDRRKRKRRVACVSPRERVFGVYSNRMVMQTKVRKSLLQRLIGTGVEPAKIDFWEGVGVILGSIFAYMSSSQYGAWFPKPWENFALFLSVLMTTTVGFWALYSLLDKTETKVPGWGIWIMFGTSFGNWYYRTFGVIPYVFEDALKAMNQGISTWTDFAALMCFIIIAFLDLVMVYNILTRATPLTRR